MSNPSSYDERMKKVGINQSGIWLKWELIKVGIL